MINLKERPFYLDREAEEWVMRTKDSMTTEEKIGQLFVLENISGDAQDMMHCFRKIQPGGVMHRPNPSSQLREIAKIMQEKVKIPLLIAGNLCNNGSDVAVDGEPYAMAMGVGACKDEKFAYRQGVVCAASGKVVGANWAFAPVCDLNLNYQNSVINTRAYGDDTELVKRMACAFIKGAQETGVAACFKHFPGDGVDFRDQHVVLSVNSMSCEEWDVTYGEIYKAMIASDALTCMAGHITLPAYSMKLNPTLSYGDCLPASLSKELMQGLLREKLGFNGLIVTDAAQMAGMAAQLPRRLAVPMAIENGADMFLFYRDFYEDVAYMQEGYRQGLLSEKRLDEAVTRILAVKAALGLHKGAAGLPKPEELHRPEFSKWAAEAAAQSITLVKNLREDLFPITPERYPKVIAYSHISKNVTPPVMRPEAQKIFMEDKEKLFFYFVKRMRGEGFEVTVYSEEYAIEKKINSYHSKEALKEFDLAVHFANVLTESGRAPRILYQGNCSNDAPDTDMYIPTILVSMTSPYLLADAPRVKTYINCYSPLEHVVDMLVEKLTGRSPFLGASPVDAFCGLEDTKW